MPLTQDDLDATLGEDVKSNLEIIEGPSTLTDRDLDQVLGGGTSSLTERDLDDILPLEEDTGFWEGLEQFGEGMSSGRIPVEATRKAAVGILQLPDSVQALGEMARGKLLDYGVSLPGEGDKSEEAIRRDIASDLQEDLENISQVEKEVSALFPGKYRAQNPVEEASADILSLLVGGIGGAGVTSKLTSTALKASAKAGIKSSKAKMIILDSLGAAIGESAVSGSETHLEPFVLGDEGTPDVIKQRLLNPIEGFGIGMTLGAGFQYLPGMTKKLFKKGDDLVDQAGNVVSMEQKVLDTTLELNDLSIQFDLPTPTLNKIMAGEVADVSPVGTETMERIFTAKSASTKSKYIDSYHKLNQLQRARGDAGMEALGIADTNAGTLIGRIQNQDKLGNTLAHSLIGDGEMASVLRPEAKYGFSLVEDTNVKPLSYIYQQARKGGASVKQVNDYFGAMDAIDDIQSVAIKMRNIDEALLDAIDPKEISKLNKAKKDLMEYKPRMSQAKAEKILESSSPVLEQALKDKNTLNNTLLDMLQQSGILGLDDVERIRAAHPNYLPAFKEVIDVTGEGSASKTLMRSSPGKAIGSRSGSDLKVVDPLEAQIQNIYNVSFASQKARTNKALLDFFMRSPDDELVYVFRESRQDILEGMQRLSETPNLKQLSAHQISKTITEEGAIETGAKVPFYIDGKRLELTIVDPDVGALLRQMESPRQLNSVYRATRQFSTAFRNLIVLDPTFVATSLMRESQDFAAWTGRGGFIKPLLKGQKPDYIPLFSQVKAMFTPETNPELYRFVQANYGFESIWGKRLVGMSREDLLKNSVEVLTDPKKQGFLKTIGNKLHGLAERGDLAPRLVSYKIAVKNGATHDEAMRTAFEMGVNFSQMGSNQAMRTATGLIPFATSYINSMDRLIRLGRYNPKKAMGAVMGVYGLYKANDIQNRQWTDSNGVPFIDKLNPDIKTNTMVMYGPWSENENDYVAIPLGWTIGRTAPVVDSMVNWMGDSIDQAVKEGAEVSINADTPEATSLRDLGVTGKDVYRAVISYITEVGSAPSTIPGISTGIQLYQNKDWRGNPIVGGHLEDRPDVLQYDSRTSPSIVALSKWFDKKGIAISPVQAEYILESNLANLGKVSLGVFDSIFLMANPDHPEQERINKGIYGTRFTPQFLNDVPNNGVPQAYFRIASEIKGARIEEQSMTSILNKTYDPYVEQKLQEFREENADLLMFGPMIEQSNLAIRALYDDIDSVRKQGPSTPTRELLGDPKKRKLVDERLMEIQRIQDNTLNIIRATAGAEEVWDLRHNRGALEKTIDATWGMASGIFPDTDLGKWAKDTFLEGDNIDPSKVSDPKAMTFQEYNKEKPDDINPDK